MILSSKWQITKKQWLATFVSNPQQKKKNAGMQELPLTGRRDAFTNQ